MLLEKPRINFGPPLSYEEAVYRLGNYSDSKDPQLNRLGAVQRMIASCPENPEWEELSTRICLIEEEDIEFMERWSFRRDGHLLGFRRIEWDRSLSAARTSYFEDVFSLEIPRTLRAWRLTPGPHHGEELICIVATPGFEDTLKAEGYVAILSSGEYNLLIGEKVY